MKKTLILLFALAVLCHVVAGERTIYSGFLTNATTFALFDVDLTGVSAAHSPYDMLYYPNDDAPICKGLDPEFSTICNTIADQESYPYFRVHLERCRINDDGLKPRAVCGLDFGKGLLKGEVDPYQRLYIVTQLFESDWRYYENKEYPIKVIYPSAEIPQYPHYREYSCPLPAGRFLHIRTFVGGETVSLDKFAYPVNYFCSRHPVVITQLATQRTTVTTDYYKKLLQGYTYVVPAGETHTYFYVPTTATAPATCNSGEIYDEARKVCVRIVSGVVYECADKTATLIDGKCVKQGVLEVVCPEGTKKIGDNCYFTAEGVCPDGTRRTIRDNQVVCEYTNTACPIGFLWDETTQQCYKNGVIRCPPNTQLKEDTCVKIGFECPTGTYRQGDVCYLPATPTCPSGFHLVGAECYPDEIKCPEGTTKFENACYAQGKLTCPSGFHLVGLTCYPDDISCPPGTTKMGGVCYYGEPQIFCPDGTKNIDGKCYLQSDVIERPVCHEDETKVGNFCITNRRSCPQGFKLVDNLCIAIIVDCPPGTVKVGEQCIIPDVYCPEGTVKANGKCYPKEEVTCPMGSFWNGSKCIGIISCPDGTTKVGDVCIKNAIDCPAGTKLQDGKCVIQLTSCPPEAPEGSYVKDGVCIVPMKPICEPPNQLVNGQCIAPSVVKLKEAETIPSAVPFIPMQQDLSLLIIVGIVILSVVFMFILKKVKK